jgi:hypothetical protein
MLLPPLPERRRVDVSVVRKEVKTMYLENGRDIFRGILILIFAAIAYWVDLTAGLVLVAFMGVMILQSAFTDWCPADLFLRLLGLPRKG